MKIEYNSNKAALLLVAVDLLEESMIVSSVSIKSLIENNGEEGYPDYDKSTLDILVNEAKIADEMISDIKEIKQELDKLVPDNMAKKMPKPNWKDNG